MGLGSRIIPLSVDDATQFTQGKSITKNADRTAIRTQRKGYDRRQLRRQALTQYLHMLGMTPDETLIKLPQQELWALRAKAVTEKISLPELGRVLYHLNQKRGYKSGKADFQDKKSSAYLSAVSDRYKELQECGLTIGQKFHAELKADPTYRCKDRVYPRQAYIEEFDRIMACQRRYHDTLTDEHIDNLRNHIIYYQRPLKSCKHLVGKCTLAQMVYTLPDGSTKSRPVKVAPKSSPLFQLCKIWESINHLTLQRGRETLEITPAQRQALFSHMNNNEKLKLTDLQKILGITKRDGWWAGESMKAGLQGNTTVVALQKILKTHPDAEALLHFDLHIRTVEMADLDTGEIASQLVVDPAFEQEPLYQLWHTLYSVSDIDTLDRILEKKFHIDDAAIRGELIKLDFTKAGYGNLSSIAMRRILPYLRQGYVYSDACFMAGYNHSRSLTREENLTRELATHLTPLAKGELRQPIVEKILNQMVNVVNALVDRYGPFDEIRVELARELQQSREKREKTYKNILNRQKENEKAAQRIIEEGVTPTRTGIQKYRLYEESHHRCIYCGKDISLKAFLSGYDTEVEHIIPRSLYFDDSFNNKVCACRACNQAKNNRTAYDYMSSLPDNQFQDYLSRIKEMLEKQEISKTKYRYLLMPEKEIPQDFLNRQMRESQYISRKALAMLHEICHHAYATSGSVTAFLRRVWGWDTVLHDLNIERYRAGNLTEMRTINNRPTECIKDWTKRLDHRHHAIDALAVACTRQGYIQRINTLANHKDEELSLERYIQQQPHFSHAEVSAAVEKILVSFKAGKRVATPGKRYIYRGGRRTLAQEGIVVPRGALSEQSVYGKISRYDKDKKRQGLLPRRICSKISHRRHRCQNSRQRGRRRHTAAPATTTRRVRRQRQKSFRHPRVHNQRISYPHRALLYRPQSRRPGTIQCVGRGHRFRQAGQQPPRRHLCRPRRQPARACCHLLARRRAKKASPSRCYRTPRRRMGLAARRSARGVPATAARRHLATATLDATKRNVYTRYARRPLCRCHGKPRLCPAEPLPLPGTKTRHEKLRFPSPHRDFCR